MHKKITQLKHKELSYKVFEYINNHIDVDIDINFLAKKLDVNKFHLHKVFKKEFNTNIYETIKSIRLQKASNLLLTNKNSSISYIAKQCGYSSQTSFIIAFKKKFNQTPKFWRNGGFKIYSENLTKMTNLSLEEKFDYSKIEVKIKKVKEFEVYYILQKGYFFDESLNNWRKLHACVLANNITNYLNIGIFYSNPSITKTENCFYATSIAPKDLKEEIDLNLIKMNLSGGLYACFDMEGKYGDSLSLIKWLYQTWLPTSGFEATTKPAYTIYHNNPIFDRYKKFKATLYLPINF